MRITIDIDGETVNVTTEPPLKVAWKAPLAATAAASRRTPPPELREAAAALGAHDAGPAPAHIADLSAAERKAITGTTDAGASRAAANKKIPIGKIATKPAVPKNGADRLRLTAQGSFYRIGNHADPHFKKNGTRQDGTALFFFGDDSVIESSG